MSEQVKDISPIIGKSIIVMLAAWSIDYFMGQNFETHPFLRILMNGTLFTILYFLMAYYSKSTAWTDFLDLAKQSRLYKNIKHISNKQS